MEEQAKLAEPTGNHKRKNRGSFQPGDARINRLGRRLKRVPTLDEKIKAWDGKRPCPRCGREPLPKSGRLMQELVREESLRRCLANLLDPPYVLSLPGDVQ